MECYTGGVEAREYGFGPFLPSMGGELFGQQKNRTKVQEEIFKLGANSRQAIENKTALRLRQLTSYFRAKGKLRNCKGSPKRISVISGRLIDLLFLID